VQVSARFVQKFDQTSTFLTFYLTVLQAFGHLSDSPSLGKGGTSADPKLHRGEVLTSTSMAFDLLILSLIGAGFAMSLLGLAHEIIVHVGEWRARRQLTRIAEGLAGEQRA
jgi:hypothetical protein